MREGGGSVRERSSACGGATGPASPTGSCWGEGTGPGREPGTGSFAPHSATRYDVTVWDEGASRGSEPEESALAFCHASHLNRLSCCVQLRFVFGLAPVLASDPPSIKVHTSHSIQNLRKRPPRLSQRWTRSAHTTMKTSFIDMSRRKGGGGCAPVTPCDLLRADVAGAEAVPDVDARADHPSRGRGVGGGLPRGQGAGRLPPQAPHLDTEG